ncbi:MAG: XRE family transcriptional regulator [Firmicutes bacterium]|nr:XRE family transcriptional regulator [Bacillota bacterium]
MYKELFSENLRLLIGNKSVSQVAKEIGIPRQTLSRYLLCQQEIVLENLIKIKIADFFDEGLDDLVGRKIEWLN